jgi:serine phosphatase RsbU (regulator of sigma subunit)
MKLFYSIVFLLISYVLTAQNEIGLLSIRNYGQEDFNSQVQNFFVTQDKNGIVYVGNKEGVLEYRGGIWRKHQLSNLNDARCIGVAKNGIIYASGLDEFGYFMLDTTTINSTSKFKYFSLRKNLDSLINYGTINRIAFQGDFVYFLSENNLFIFHNNKVSIIESGDSYRGFLYHNDVLYIKIDNFGLKRIHDNKLIQVAGCEAILTEKVFNAVQSDEKAQKIMIPTIGQYIQYDREWNLAYSQQKSFFLFKIVNDKLEVKSYDKLSNVKDLSISDMVRIGENTIALGTSNEGIYLVNLQGEILLQINTNSNLANNKINSLYFDKQHQLWAALEQGISRIKLDDQWQSFSPSTASYSGTIESISRFNDELYIAAQGLYKLTSSTRKGEKSTFKRILDPVIENLGCYGLDVFTRGNISKLLIITDNGLAEMDVNGNFKDIVPAFIWSIHPDAKDSNRIWLGLEDGLASIYFNGKNFDLEGRVPGINMRCQFIEQDKNGDIWSSNIFSKVVFLSNPEFRNNKIYNFSIKTFSSSDGLPADNAIYPKEIDGEMFFGTGEGIFTFDLQNNKFLPTDKLGSIFYSTKGKKGRQCHRIFEDSKENLWIVSKNEDESRLQIYLLRKNLNSKKAKYSIEKVFEVKGKGDIFNAIYEDKKSIMWVGGVSSLYRYQPQDIKDSIPAFFTYIVRVVAGNDTISQGFQFLNDQLYVRQQPGQTEIIEYENNKLVFTFGSLLRNNEEAVLFSYKLEGFDEEWSKWDIRNEERFTNLPEGSYVFMVRAMDRLGNISQEATYSFVIKPPWYRTIWAFIGYVLFFVAFVWGAIRVSTRSLKKIIREATAEIQAQKDELQEKNQNILDSIRYAKRIQEAVTPSEVQMKRYFPDHFVLWRPRDIVSGDFYWMMNKQNKTVIAAADCTGHGVPGAFMSIMGISFLNQIANLPEVQTAADALNHLRHNVITSLNKEGSETDTKDGMDISLCVFDYENMIMDFSGAYNPLYMVRNGEISVVKADRMPVGVHERMEEPFTTNKFTMMKGDVFYILSDGYIDQFGGPQGKKFMTKQFKELILEIYQKPMDEQSRLLEQTLIDWRGEIEQVDDIIIIGIRIV